MKRNKAILVLACMLIGSSIYACSRDTANNIKEESTIRVSFYLPDDMYDQKDKFIEKLSLSIDERDVGEILNIDRSKRSIEITLKIDSLQSVSDLKDIFITLSPVTEYRIEHL